MARKIFENANVRNDFFIGVAAFTALFLSVARIVGKPKV